MTWKVDSFSLKPKMSGYYDAHQMSFSTSHVFGFFTLAFLFTFQLPLIVSQLVILCSHFHL